MRFWRSTYSAAFRMFTVFPLKRAFHSWRDKSKIQGRTMSRDMYSAVSFAIIYMYIFEYKKTQVGEILLVYNFYRIVWVYCTLKTIRREVKFYIRQNIMGRRKALRTAHLTGSRWSHIWATAPLNRWYFINYTDAGFIMGPYIGDQNIARRVLSEMRWCGSMLPHHHITCNDVGFFYRILT